MPVNSLRNASLGGWEILHEPGNWQRHQTTAQGAGLQALAPLSPVFLSYTLSFIYIGIFWNKLQYANHPERICAPRAYLFEQYLGCQQRFAITAGGT
jgi:hypothetical protein